MEDLDTSRRPAIIMRVGQPAEFVPDFEPTLENLKKAVGGNFDLAACDPYAIWAIDNELYKRYGVHLISGKPERHLRLVVHDEGLLLDLPPNKLATSLYAGRNLVASGFNLVGDVVLVEVE